MEIAKGARTFLKDVNDFGTVQRTNLLKLRNTPVVLLDDGSARAFAGGRRSEVVDVASKADVLGNPVTSVPLDVFAVGATQLTEYGVPAAQQTSIFKKWRSLPDAQKKVFVDQWEEVETSDQAALNAFLQMMIDNLS
jgi:hypothetical protein